MAEDPEPKNETPAPEGDLSRTEVLLPENRQEAPDAPFPGRPPSDDYAICGKIGDGGMGVVYLARDRRLGRYVAVKRLNERALADPVLRKRFLHEARAVAALNHAYIVHIYALGEDALGPYIVMEYVSGPADTEVVAAEGPDAPPPRNMTLERFVSSRGPMTADEAVAMLLKISRAIVYAHSCGVIHRDLKPSNILLDPTQEPKLVDFGLARVEARGASEPADLTVPGEKLVSLGYSAPELEQDASTSDARADVYSLGAILYFLLTGRNPRYYREQDVPAFLREVLRRCLETVREQRYRSAQDFVRALTEAASHGRTVAPTIKTTWRCKWCDAVNPISTKFCAECGWDGSERCLECGAETFVGQQFCPSCGADCRMYEHVASIIQLMDQAWNERRFERIATIAGRLHGFEPAGPSGRKILTEARRREEEAERNVARRNRLAILIPNELKAENYERAQAFIEEFRTLNEDALVYEEELRAIPGLILDRDLVRIRQCLRSRDWATARHLAEGLAVKYGDMPEFQDVRNTLRRHERCRRRVRWGLALGFAAWLYLLSLPWAGRLAGGSFGPLLQALYTPARVVFLIPGLDRYVPFCDNGRLAGDYFASASAPEAEAAPAAPRRLPDGGESLRADFEAQLRNIQSSRQDQERYALAQYHQDLNELRRTVQEEGDYEAVMAADRALKAYAENQSLAAVAEGDPKKLVVLKQRCAQTLEDVAKTFSRPIVSVEKKYVASLDELRRSYTQRGDMERAGIVSDEIQRVHQLPEVLAAEATLAKAGGNAGASARPSAPAGLSAIPSAEELGLLRLASENLQNRIEEIDRKTADTLGNWPERYMTALETLKERFRLAGDFNGWEAIAGELARFEESKTLGVEDVLAEPEGLRQTQEAFILRRQAVYDDRDMARAKAFRHYVARLERQKSDLTKQGRMDAAAAINQELRRVQQDPVYLSLSHLSIPEDGTESETPSAE